MFGKCEKCSSFMKILMLNRLLIQILKTPIQATVTAIITSKLLCRVYEWACEGTKLKQMLFKESIDIATRKFTSTMTTLKHHIHVKRVQFNQYSSIKSNLGRNDILVHVEYSERCEDKRQHEIQKHLLRSYVIQYIYRKLLLSIFWR